MSDPLREMSDSAKHAIDAVSIGTGVAALVQWLPSIAAILTIIWTALRIYETRTIQRLLGRDESPAE
ncbi:MAG: hypothetical protein WCY92_11730 [Novosphingobium sp.]